MNAPTHASLAASGIKVVGMGRNSEFQLYPGQVVSAVRRNGFTLGYVLGNSTRRNRQSSRCTAYPNIGRKPLGEYSSSVEAAVALNKRKPVTHAERVLAAVVREMRQDAVGARFTAKGLADEIVSVETPGYAWGHPVSWQAVEAALWRLYSDRYVRVHDGKPNTFSRTKAMGGLVVAS